MPFNIPVLLIPLLGGFVFVTYFNRTKWYAVRAEKDRLVLYASIAGFIHLVLAWAITSLLPYLPCTSSMWCFSDSLQRWKHLWDVTRPFPYAGTAMLSFLLAAVSWWPLNRYLFDEDKESYRINVQEGGPLEQLLDAAMQSRKHVMVTLKNDKTYIGFVDSSFSPGQLSRTIRIWPTKSGYRGTDKRVVSTVNYTEVYQAIGEDFKKQAVPRRIPRPNSGLSRRCFTRRYSLNLTVLGRNWRSLFHRDRWRKGKATSVLRDHPLTAQR